MLQTALKCSGEESLGSFNRVCLLAKRNSSEDPVCSEGRDRRVTIQEVILLAYVHTYTHTKKAKLVSFEHSTSFSRVQDVSICRSSSAVIQNR